MTKERNRFDALAEELEAAEPKPEPETAAYVSAGMMSVDEARGEELDQIASTVGLKREPNFPPPPVQARSRVTGKKSDAFLSVMGSLYPVISFTVSAKYKDGDDLFERTADRWRTSYDVKVKVPGNVRSEHLLKDPSVVLVMCKSNGEREYMQLGIRSVVVIRTSTDSYTDITAYGTEVAR